MEPWHKELIASGRWFSLSLFEQLGNVGSEVSRARKWRGRDQALFDAAIFRALELLDLTIQDKRWLSGVKELTRARELLCNAAFGGEDYNTSLEDLDAYFFQYALAARLHK